MNTFEFYSNTDGVQDDVASAPWPNSPWATGNFSYTSVPQSTHPDLFTPTPTTEMGMFTNPALPTTQVDYTYQSAPNPWMPGPSFFDAGSAVSPLPPVGDPHWAGVAPLSAYSAAATPDLGVSPTSTTPTSLSQDEWAWSFDLLQYSSMIPASSSGHGGEAGCVAPEPGANLSEVMASQAGWDTGEFSRPTPAAQGHVVSGVTPTFAPIVALGKRHREAEEPQSDGGLVGIHAHEVPPQKRARGSGTTKGILKAARSAAKTHHEPVARIPEQRFVGIPKAAGRGAERLATPSAQGIYRQTLPGPSSQRGWAVDAAHGKPNWDEGSVDEEAAHHVENMVEQHQEVVTNRLFKIPRKFEQAHRSLLEASDADFARGAVEEIKCRLCPNKKFENFYQFKRHCNFTETHPLVIDFCNKCGDFYARPDALKRHGKVRPSECRRATPEMAAQKRRATEVIHEEFIQKLKQGLKTWQDIGKPFSHIIKDKYPGSSKKRTDSGNEGSRG